ncbi:DedA family protein [Patescibacteria group bacterium]|nr:DedA family protein [Patescibacteria group bacterium]
MFCESFNIPIPSEVVMTYSGYLASKGMFNIYLVILVGTLGNVFGSILSYILGYYKGYDFLEKYGKYILLSDKDLKRAHSWILKYGDITVFVSRILPIVRTFISLPAGILKMDFKKFIIFTTLGSLIWTTILAFLGLYFGVHWIIISKYVNSLSLPIVILIIISVIVYVYIHVKKFRS